MYKKFTECVYMCRKGENVKARVVNVPTKINLPWPVWLCSLEYHPMHQMVGLISGQGILEATDLCFSLIWMFLLPPPLLLSPLLLSPILFLPFSPLSSPHLYFSILPSLPLKSIFKKTDK